MTADLVQFIRARLDEEAAVARDAGGDSIETMDGAFPGEKYLVLRGDHPDRFTAPLSTDLAAHIARHSPARTIAQIEAHRQLVDDMADVVGGEYIDDGEPILAGWVLQRLSLLYADHPDYREEWRPVTG